MKMIFDALEDRFGTNKRLRIIGRKLVRPTEINPKNEVRPFVTVDGSMVEKLDTFTSDLEKWRLSSSTTARACGWPTLTNGWSR